MWDEENPQSVSKIKLCSISVSFFLWLQYSWEQELGGMGKETTSGKTMKMYLVSNIRSELSYLLHLLSSWNWLLNNKRERKKERPTPKKSIDGWHEKVILTRIFFIYLFILYICIYIYMNKVEQAERQNLSL